MESPRVLTNQKRPIVRLCFEKNVLLALYYRPLLSPELLYARRKAYLIPLPLNSPDLCDIPTCNSTILPSWFSTTLTNQTITHFLPIYRLNLLPNGTGIHNILFHYFFVSLCKTHYFKNSLVNATPEIRLVLREPFLNHFLGIRRYTRYRMGIFLAIHRSDERLNYQNKILLFTIIEQYKILLLIFPMLLP